MKKLTLAAALILFASPVLAQTTGGFTGPTTVKQHTVAEVKTLADDTQIIMVGNIAESLGDEKYTFKDATGTIIVEIDDEDWRGLVVAPEDTVTITGEVDKDMLKEPKVEVKTITKQ